MATAKQPIESGKFKIINDGCIVEFTSKGSMVAVLADAFGWLSAERRARALDRMQKAHAELLAKEAADTLKA